MDSFDIFHCLTVVDIKQRIQLFGMIMVIISVFSVLVESTSIFVLNNGFDHFNIGIFIFKHIAITIYTAFAFFNACLCFLALCKDKLLLLRVYNIAFCTFCIFLIVDAFVSLAQTGISVFFFINAVISVYFCYYTCTLKARLDKEGENRIETATAYHEEATRITAEEHEKPKFVMQISVEKVEEGTK